MRRARFALFFVSVVTALAGCGYKGPLYLPKPDASPTQSAPAPAPVNPQQDSKQ